MRFGSRQLLSQSKLRLLSMIVAVSVTLFGAQNCDSVRLSVLEKTPTASISGSGFGTLQPVLAVRKTACIMCHAQVNGDLVTDLGFGDPFFMGADDVVNHPNQPDYGPFTSKHFVASGQTWAYSSVMGDIYIPDAEIKDERLREAYANGLTGNPPLSRPLRLIDFVTGKFINPTIDLVKPQSLIGKSTSTDMRVPGLRGDFRTRKSILISAPTAKEIQDLELDPKAEKVLAQPGITVFKGTTRDVLGGFKVQQSQKTSKLILTNSGDAICRGDIIIQGTLFLKNLRLDTDLAGCRLYVTGTVFIQGPITYVRNDNGSNLQITSSRAIIMGMRDLGARLTQKGVPSAISGIRAASTEPRELTINEEIFRDRDSVDELTNDAGPFQIMVDPTQTKILAVLRDFDNDVWEPATGQTSFPDPKSCSIGTPTAGSPCGVNWTGTYAAGLLLRKTVNYSHLLLNAPTIQSRYFGTFQGVIVAEDALFSPSNFVFEKSSILTQTTLLPLLADRIFRISKD